jgi:tetratricopeptide (TPR) repeat protein
VSRRDAAGPQVGSSDSPAGVRTLDELASRLRALRHDSGLSYRQLHQRIARARRSRGVVEIPSYTTVYRCLQPGRVRLDADLVGDVAHALLGEAAAAAQWRSTYLLIAGQANEAAVVSVGDTLPTGVGKLVGRRDELRRALDVLGGPPDQPGPSILAIDGMAGVGKTTLAIHAAHEFLSRHDVGLQLGVNLRGHDPDRVPADPSAVLAAILQRLGVPGRRVHSLSPEDRATLYQDLMTDRRALLVLDNAAGVDQVRPLLPVGSGCRVLITSRHDLAEIRDIQHIHLDVLPSVDALGVLRVTAGESRIELEREAAGELATLMGNLPLALALAGSHISATPQWSIKDHLERLVERRRSLTVEDAVELAFSASYTAMPSGHQALLRLLTVHPGGDFDAYSVSALAGTGLAEAERLLDRLRADNLVLQRSTGRYELHDLVRLFAADRSRDEDPPRVRHGAFDRLLAYYRAAANDAMDAYYPAEKHFRPDCPVPATPTPRFEDRETARAWLDLERSNLVTVAVEAAHLEPSYTIDLSRILYRYLDVESYYPEAERLHTSAAQVAEGSDKAHALTSLGDTHRKEGRCREALSEQEEAVDTFRLAGDRTGELRALQNWAIAEWALGRYDQAEQHLRATIDIAQDHGDLRTEGQAQALLGGLLNERGRHQEAREVFERALPKVRETGNRVFEGQLLTDLGDLHTKLGDPTKAIEYLEAGLSLGRTFGNRAREADALTQLGNAHACLGRHEMALELHEQSLRIAREDGIRHIETYALSGLAESLRGLGQLERSLEHHEAALSIADEMGYRHETAHAHDEIATTCSAMGRMDEAMAHWREALALYDDLDSRREADRVATKLLEHST